MQYSDPTPYEPAAFAIGERVYDREDDDPNTAIVVNTPPIPANDWEVYGGPTTVADDNLDYPAETPIVMIIFEDDLSDLDNWDQERYLSISDLSAVDAPSYTFPAPRLTQHETANSDCSSKTIDDQDGTDTTESTPTANITNGSGETMNDGPAPLAPELTALEEHLINQGLNVYPADDGQLPIVEKLGVTYYVQPVHIKDDVLHREQIECLLDDRLQHTMASCSSR